MSGATRPLAVVLTTASSGEEAERLATALVERRLAACVNIVSGVRSIYRWKGGIQKDGEHLLVIKTAADRFAEIRETIRALHAYELPELILIPIDAADPEYAGWLEGSIA